MTIPAADEHAGGGSGFEGFDAGQARRRNTGALKDLRVVEMGTLIAGPFCGQLLGDIGRRGDQDRAARRRRSDAPVGPRADGPSLWWEVIARNKKSVSINLRAPEGQDAGPAA